MALSTEWRHRIERWEEVLWRLFYRPLGTFPLSGFTTHEQLTITEAEQHEFKPVPPGTRWGSKWEYGWFKGELVLPPEAQGQRIALHVDPGSESIVWVDGKAAGARDWAHPELTLARSAQAGTRYSILVEAYAGHGPISVGEGPVPFGKITMPEPGPTQVTVGTSSFGIWREEIYQLAVDFTTLFQLRNELDPNLLRTSEIDRGLIDATMIVDLELPEEQLLASVRAGRERLKPLLESKNGPTMPVLHAFGHAHIDVAWLWPLAETERKMARTVSTQLALMEEYPEFRFLQSQPHLYMMLKQRYPELYERFSAAARAGQFIPDGAMWVEADTNVSGGESLIRQVLYGRRFFKQEFGVDADILWLPDVFGYSGALPQILRGCGCKGFATQKITWAYNGGDPFPYNTFWWEGIDGTSIPAHIFTDYNSYTRPKSVFERWNTRLQKNGISSLILAFGHGDGGGGPTRDHLEFLRRSADLEGMPRVRISSPAEFFRDLQAQGLPRERYVGELYFQAHRGTYTSQSRTKRGNRRSEFALREAELWGTAARVLQGFVFTPATLANDWRKVLLNQFHDILPGSSIHRVYEEAEASFAEVITTAQKTAQAAGSAFVTGSDGYTIFNSLGWPRRAQVSLPQGSVDVEVPACGWTTVPAVPPAFTGQPAVLTPAAAGGFTLENQYLRAEMNARGEITSWFDKAARREFLSGPANRLLLYKDVPDNWDAWDLDSMAEDSPVAIDEPVQLEIGSNGPLAVSVKLTRQLQHSSLQQEIVLRHDSHRIDFITTVDWQESHRLLKVAFPTNIHAHEAIHEVQFGHLRRPNHRSRPYDADRFEVCNHKWSALAEEARGAAVLNDCKYGLSVKGNTINLTLLKSALAPDMTADKGQQMFTYSLYTWNGSLAESGVVRESYDLNCPVMVLPGSAGEGSLFSVDAGSIVIETVKPAEDGSTDVVVRLYESKRTAARCTLTTAIPVVSAHQADMMEQPTAALPCSNGKIDLEFRPFEIKTVILHH